MTSQGTDPACLWVFRSLQWRCGWAVACCRARCTENSACRGPFWRRSSLLITIVWSKKVAQLFPTLCEPMDYTVMGSQTAEATLLPWPIMTSFKVSLQSTVVFRMHLALRQVHNPHPSTGGERSRSNWGQSLVSQTVQLFFCPTDVFPQAWASQIPPRFKVLISSFLVLFVWFGEICYRSRTFLAVWKIYLVKLLQFVSCFCLAAVN